MAPRRFLRARRFALRGVDFRVLIPVDVRSAGSDAAAANQVSALFLSLPVSEPNPRRRFERIRNETARLKASHASEGLDWILRLADRTGFELPTYGWTRLARRLAPFHMVVTNVRGPQFPLYLLDARLDAIHPQAPLLPCQGLGVAVMSYCGRVHFGLMADRDLLPDVTRLAERLDAAFGELRSLGAPPEGGPRFPRRRHEHESGGASGPGLQPSPTSTRWLPATAPAAAIRLRVKSPQCAR